MSNHRKQKSRFASSKLPAFFVRFFWVTFFVKKGTVFGLEFVSFCKQNRHALDLDFEQKLLTNTTSAPCTNFD